MGNATTHTPAPAADRRRRIRPRPPRRTTLVGLAGSLALVCAVAGPSTATAQLLTDTGFGGDGRITVDLLDDVGQVTVDSSGRILVVGFKDDSPTTGQVAVARYLSTGVPDPSFSGDGRADLPLTGSSAGALGIRVLANGTVVIAGETQQGATRSMFVARLSTAGALEPGFGTGGVVTPVPVADYFGSGASAIGPDGAVIISGYIGTGFLGNHHTLVSATGVQSEFSLIDRTPTGAGCFNSTQPARYSALSFVSATEVLYAIDSAFPDASCPGGAVEGAFVVRQTIGSATVWAKRYLKTYVASAPVVLGSELVVRLNGRFDVPPPRPQDSFYRLDAATGAPSTTWGPNGQVPLVLPQPAPINTFIDGSELVGVAGGGFTMSTSYYDDDLGGGPSTLTTYTSAGDLDASTTQAVTAFSATSASDLAGSPDGGVVWMTWTATGPAELHRFRPAASTPDAVPLAPARVLDTRPSGETVDGAAQGGGRAAPGSVTKVRVAGRGSVPAGATAAIVNLTVVAPDGPGFATLYPCTPEPPNASNINYGAGAFIANSATAKLDAAGDVCVFTLAAADLLIDVNGFVPAGSGVGTLTPARLLDTRAGGSTIDGVSQRGGQAAAGSVTKVRVAGRGSVPDGASAAILNLTVAAPAGPGFATVYPCTPEPPNASNINYEQGAFVANNVAVRLDANGDVCIFTLAATDLLIDVNAFVTAGASVGTLTPARLLDTRPSGTTIDSVSQATGEAAAGSVTKVRIAGRGEVPSDATTAIVNLTAVSPASAGFATVYPCTPEPPTASNINYTAGAFVANNVTAKLDANGDVCIFTLAATNLLLDVNGYVTG